MGKPQFGMIHLSMSN